MDGPPDEEAGAAPDFALDRQLSPVLVGDDTASDREAKARAAADRLGREEGVEDPRTELWGDAATGVFDGDLDGVAAGSRADADGAPVGAAARLGLFGDGMGGVHDQIQENLTELARVSHDWGHLVEPGLHVGHVLV